MHKGFFHIHLHLEKKPIKYSSPSCTTGYILRKLYSLNQTHTDTLSSYIQLEAHVALTAIVIPRQGDTSAIQAEVTDRQAHVGDIPS